MGASSSTTSEMKSTAPAIDASVKDPITEPEKEVICSMETFSTVYRAKIKHYSQVKLCPRDFSIDCGTFDLAGHRWAIFYLANGYSQDQVAFHIKLLTDTTTSLKQYVKISLIDPSGRHLMVGDTRWIYKKRDDYFRMTFMLNTKLDSSEYVKDDCLTFECIVSVTKWSPAEVVKKKPQSAITFSNLQEESGEEADFSFVGDDTVLLDVWS